MAGKRGKPYPRAFREDLAQYRGSGEPLLSYYGVVHQWSPSVCVSWSMWW